MTELTFPASPPPGRPPLPPALMRRPPRYAFPRSGRCPRCRVPMNGRGAIEGGPSGVPGEVICNRCHAAMVRQSEAVS